jgi:ParB-like chromosome segregation protein Spo0J
MQLFSSPLALLKEDPRNARKHSRRNLDRIKASLERFGQQTPIVIDADDVVRKGNGTFRAAGELGWLEINCVRTDLAGVDATAYAIADNKASDDGEWDELMLAETLRSLQSEEDATIAAATGFADDEVDALVEKLANEHAREEAGPSVLGEDSTRTPPLVNLKWGKTSVPLTEAELARIDELYEAHVAASGTPFGFMTAILDRLD